MPSSLHAWVLITFNSESVMLYLYCKMFKFTMWTASTTICAIIYCREVWNLYRSQLQKHFLSILPEKYTWEWFQSRWAFFIHKKKCQKVKRIKRIQKAKENSQKLEASIRNLNVAIATKTAWIAFCKRRITVWYQFTLILLQAVWFWEC